MDIDEIMPTLPLHRFIAIVKVKISKKSEKVLKKYFYFQTEEQVEQLRRAILTGNHDVAELDEKGYSSLHWAGQFLRNHQPLN